MVGLENVTCWKAQHEVPTRRRKNVEMLKTCVIFETRNGRFSKSLTYLVLDWNHLSVSSHIWLPICQHFVAYPKSPNAFLSAVTLKIAFPNDSWESEKVFTQRAHNTKGKTNYFTRTKNLQNYQSSDWTQYSCIKCATNRLERFRIIIWATCVKHALRKHTMKSKNVYDCSVICTYDRRMEPVTARKNDSPNYLLECALITAFIS